MADIIQKRLLAEKLILKNLFSYSHLVAEVCDVLNPADFSLAEDRTIYSAMIKLLEIGNPIDLITVCNLLKTEDKLMDIGGCSYVSGILGYETYNLSFREAIEIIKNDQTSGRVFPKL